MMQQKVEEKSRLNGVEHGSCVGKQCVLSSCRKCKVGGLGGCNCQVCLGQWSSGAVFVQPCSTMLKALSA